MKTLFLNHDIVVRAGWKISARLLLTGVLAATLIAVRRILPTDFNGRLSEPFLMAASALLAAWICVRLERVTLSTLGLRFNVRFLRNVGLGMLAGIGMLSLSALLVWLGDGFHLELVSTPEGGVAVVWKITWTLLALAVFEELTFRGYPFQRAVASLGVKPALLLFALLFAGVHLPNPGLNTETFSLALANLILASILLGQCYLRSGSLALPIGVHLGWNWAQTCLGFPSSGTSSHGLWQPVYHAKAAWLTGGEFGLEASLAGVVVLAVAVIVLTKLISTPVPARGRLVA